eukprot:scaffold20221_cov71-Phaeocystis_antarctica.AAC.1
MPKRASGSLILYCAFAESKTTGPASVLDSVDAASADLGAAAARVRSILTDMLIWPMPSS